MLVSWKWLNELVEIKMAPEELAQKMTMSGVAVEGIEYLNKNINGVITGYIAEIKKHPEADKLLICMVDIGKEEPLTIITGADNVREGQKVPVAIHGAVLPDGKKIKKAKLRGMASEGMLCSAGELGLDEDKILPEQKDGIYILTDEVPIGKDIVDVLGLDDVVLELELTPNRSDCLGMRNVAKEVAAVTGGKLLIDEDVDYPKEGPGEKMTRIDILDTDLCRRYVTKIIKNVEIKPSPMWLQHRLMASGIRPISNIVDVTNYIMIETGQPLHAFDYDALKENRIVVRRAKEGEELVTLDNQKRALNPEMLVIADAGGPVALAGVMGGLDTEVTSKTKTILLESAFFHGINIRRTSKALGLGSEAAVRFEKSVDLKQTAFVANRAALLMAQLGGGEAVEGYVDCFPAPEDKKPIPLSLSRINQLLGTDIKQDEVEEILAALNITILENDMNKWMLAAPSYRRDLEREVDIIEEVARIYGYDKIPTTLPFGATTQGYRTTKQRLKEKAEDTLIALGMMEVITYSFINPRHFEWLRMPESYSLRNAVIVKNPLSEEQGVMRTTIIPGLLETVKRNINKRNKNLMFFEMGMVYIPEGFPEQRDLPIEKLKLNGIVTGKKEKFWNTSGTEYDFYYVKGILENMLHELGIDACSYIQETQIPFLHPGRAASIVYNDVKLGYIGEIHPLVQEKYDVDQRVIVFELDFDEITRLYDENKRYQPITKYPAVTRDLGVIVPEEVSARELEETVKECGKELLQDVRLFDVYKGKQIENGCKSMAFSLTWQAEDKTLTDDEVNALHVEIEKVLHDKYKADLRRS